MLGKTSYKAGAKELMVKPHRCTSVLSLFRQFSMLGAASGFRHSFGAWRGLRSIDRAGDLT